MVDTANTAELRMYAVQILVEGDAHALLAGFDVIGFGDAAAPVMVAVVADQIGDRRAGDGGGEDVRVRG